MMPILGLLVTLSALFSMAGWGLFCSAIAGYQLPKVPIAAVIGMAAVIFIGGLLNLFHCAYGGLLDVLLVVGLALFTVLGYTRLRSLLGSAGKLYSGLVWLFALILAGLAGSVQFAPSAFNFHDDFEKYFTYPVRMLQTGTLAGNPLSALGSETMGGQVLLHGMVLNHFPVEYINGVDAVFGLLLCMLLPVSLLTSRASSLIPALGSIAVVVTINPQIINVSAGYIACALVMTIILLFRGGADGLEQETLPPVMLVGLLMAALVTLKSLLLLFAALFFAMLIGEAFLLKRDMGERIHWVARAVMATALFLMPWVALYLPQYAHAGSGEGITTVPPGKEEIYREPMSLFSAEQVYYGNSYFDYTLVVILTLALGALAIAAGRRNYGRSPLGSGGIVAACAAIALSYIGMLALGPLLNGYFHSLRYAIPLILAGVPVIGSGIIAVAVLGETRWKVICVAAVLTAEGIITALFADNFSERILQGRRFGNMLAFSALASSPGYLSYNSIVLHGPRRAYCRRIQEIVPPGEPFLAWTSTPFHFDYGRNVIYDVQDAGVGTPWAVLPAVKYFVVEYEGYAVISEDALYEDLKYPGARERYVSRKCFSLRNRLAGLRATSREMYDDGSLVVFSTAEVAVKKGNSI